MYWTPIQFDPCSERRRDLVCNCMKKGQSRLDEGGSETDWMEGSVGPTVTFIVVDIVSERRVRRGG